MEARRQGLTNFSLLTSLFRVSPAINAILADPDTRANAFLTAGHVCTITGIEPYHELAQQYHTPMVVTGFEPLDILYGIYRCVLQLEAGTYVVENAYKRAVPENGNKPAQELMNELLEVSDQEWRGLGVIPNSGFRLRPLYELYNADKRYQITQTTPELPSHCKAGQIMKGLMQPSDCPHFGISCHPASPLGAPMVSGEGVCAAYFRYK